MRSSSFRRSSASQGSKSSTLPPLSGEEGSVQEVYRKHTTRIEELEKDNKRLEKELQDANGHWRKTEDQLQDLREANVDTAELRQRLDKAEQKTGEIEALVSVLPK